jgi:hypothetical protein
MQHSQLLFNLENKTKDFSYTIFPVKKNKYCKNFKIMGKSLFNYFFIHILKLKISGCDKSTPLNGISSRDSKKEEARRREINKNIAIEVGRRSSTFVDWCGVFNLFLQ